MLVDSGKEKVEDKIFDSHEKHENYKNKLFIRVGAKGKRFEGVDFTHTYFDNCYFKDCVFDSCSFIGAKFLNSNFTGSNFCGCKFEYAFFQNTLLEYSILEESCPGYENQKLKFARTLRKNFESIGDAESANKAIKVELIARGLHLKKTWKSNEGYYRRKYSGGKRIAFFFRWLYFRIQSIVWGNGESAWKLVKTCVFLWLLMSVLDVWILNEASSETSFLNSLIKMPHIFLSIEKPENYPDFYLSIIYVVRLVAFGLFMSIILKRFNHR